MKTIGEKIKVLRREAGLNQQQLADKLGLSNQAISKWETNTTQPEITLLPEIATVFGVSIDELFDYTTEKYLDKIESRLDSGQALTISEVAKYELFLLDASYGEHASRKEELLAYLYLSSGEDFMAKANNLSKKILLDKPNDKASLSIISQTSKGYLFDWDVRNHTELIDYYIQTLEQNPKQTSIYLYLLDNLLDDWRVEEAKIWLEKAQVANPDPIHAYYELVIREKEQGFTAVKDDYLAFADQHADDWRLLFSVANSLSAHGCYEEVIPIWERAYEAQEKPRFTDYHTAIAHCYLLLGDKAGAIKAYEKVLDILKTDWNCRFGKEIDNVQAKIDQLKEV